VKVEWTPAGGAKVTLIEDAASRGDACILESGPGADDLVQTEPLYGGAVQFAESRDNALGECNFTATKTHASLDALASYFATEFARKGKKGLLEMTFGSHKWVMDNAVLKGVHRVQADDATGVRLKIRYSFVIVTLTYS
jgi:hypothetical protein